MRVSGMMLALALDGVGVMTGPCPAAAGGTGLEFIGEATFPTGYRFRDTEVGGLSGIDYNRRRGVYYAISDDRSSTSPARFYTLAINLSDGALDPGDITFRNVTVILDRTGQPFAPLTVDPESIRYDRRTGRLLWSSEGDANALVPPFVREMTGSGAFLRELPASQAYAPTADQSSGIRNNLAFESLSLAPTGGWGWTATENALYQDGPAAAVGQSSPSRMMQFNLGTGSSTHEFVYEVEPVVDEPDPAGSFATNGLVEILALGNSRFLTVERSFSTGKGNVIRLYVADRNGATDIGGDASIQGRTVVPMRKRLLADLADFGIVPDNIEGVTFGPRLPDGRRALVLVADNNFSVTQLTQFLAFALDDDALDDAVVEPVE